jgi:RNA polymerase sigma-32 factor
MNLALAPFPNTFPQRLPSPSDFTAYARAAHEMPLLSEEEEKACIEAWREHQDKEAARRLVLAHLRLVVRVVKNHEGYGMSPGDLAQEGTVGLMKAVRRFSPAVGVRLAMYALRWIEAEIREFIFRNLRQVRLSGTKSLRRLFFGYRQAVNRLQRWTGEERPEALSSEEWAKALGVSSEDIHLVEQYFGGTDQSLVIHHDGEGGEGESERPLHQRLPSPYQAHDSDTQDPSRLVEENDHRLREQAMTTALGTLSDREQAIVRARWLASPPQGLAELGKEWGVSAERIRQIEVQAIKRLRQALLPALVA